jgi:hypothetical protein
MNSPKRLARIAGVLSLLVGLFGGFVDPKMYLAGNAAATAANVAANAGLVSMGVVAHLTLLPHTCDCSAKLKNVVAL